jgi:hypothetical protein
MRQIRLPMPRGRAKIRKLVQERLAGFWQRQRLRNEARAAGKSQASRRDGRGEQFQLWEEP